MWPTLFFYFGKVVYCLYMSIVRFVSVALFFSLLFPLVSQAAVFNDPGYEDQWYLERISSEQAWQTTSGSNQIIVAVLDSAISIDHPDLAVNTWINPLEIAGNDLDDDGNGFIDDVSGWDFVDEDADVRPDFSQDDELSHGTFVAGLIAAEANNATGYIGVAHKTALLPLRILDAEGNGTEEDTAEAVDYAVARGARVINLSIAGGQISSRLRTSIRRAYDAGVVVVAALGNEAQNVDEYPVFPACLGNDSADWVIGVAATDYFDGETDFTNYGATCADLSAPGEEMLGLSVYGEGRPEGGDITWTGTSAATPLVAGGAALLLARYPDLTPEQVRVILKLSVDPVRSHLSAVNAIGVGRLNVARALTVGASFSSALPLSEQVTPLRPLAHLGIDYFAFGSLPGEAPLVRLYDGVGTELVRFAPYDARVTGGIEVTLGDVAGSEVPEIVTGMSVGAPLVRVFTTSGQLARAFYAGDSGATHGVRLAVGDIIGDTYQDIVAATVGGEDVVVYSDMGVELARFAPTGFTEGVPLVVAIADVDDDWDWEIAVAELGGTRVASYDINGIEQGSFVAVPAGAVITGLQAHDFDEDYRDELVVSSSLGTIFAYNRIGALNFSVVAPAGVKIYTVDVSQDEIPDLLLGTVDGLAALTASGGVVLLPLAISSISAGGSIASW